MNKNWLSEPILQKTASVQTFFQDSRRIFSAADCRAPQNAPDLELAKRARRRKSITIQILLIIYILLLALILYRSPGVSRHKPRRSKQYPLSSEEHLFSVSDRIMIVAPHPDDETLACAGVIRRATTKRIPTLVVIMSSGDGYLKNCELLSSTPKPSTKDYRKMGTERHLETVRAMRLLGLEENNIAFLCFPDGGINSLFNDKWDNDNPHTGLNGATAPPYPYAYEKRATYCGESVVTSLAGLIERFKPSIIVYPDPGDNHHDHWATSAFVRYVIFKMNYEVKQFTYLVHEGINWPFPRGHQPMQKLMPPPEFLELNANWKKFYLSKVEENLKYRAVSQYASQKTLKALFLDAFVRKNELFASYPAITVAPVRKKPDFFVGRILPYTVFEDPERDTLKKDFEESGDLTAVGFALDKKNAWFALETRCDVAAEVIYIFHLRIFNKQGVRRLDIRIEKGNAISEELASNSAVIDGPISTETKGRRLLAQIPASMFDGASSFLFNADSYIYKRRIDRTAWCPIRLKKR